MAIDTMLVAVGPRDHERVARLAEETVDIAVPTGARVVLVRVFSQEGYEKTLSALHFDDPTTDDVARRDATIRDLEEVLDGAGVEWEVRGRIGDPGDAVVEVAETVDADVVVVGGRDRSPTGKAVFGSVGQQILLSAPCPVLYVRTGTE
ncbi:universal stress protein [Haloplanus litoreus]|uniref:Universal stress protein n=1 Tax=Haloplanus litoreus TaxID=767515 RepID=A0ABD5ZWN6_9EURY